MQMLRKICWLLFLVPALSQAASPQTPVDFVTAFYADLAKAEAVTAIGRVARLKPYFDDQLYNLLMKDEANREQNNGDEICGYIKFDVFVNAQDAGANIKKMEVVKSYPQILVGVTFVESLEPDLYIQMKMENKIWKITDFFYPDHFTKERFSLIPQLQEAQAQVCKQVSSPAEVN